MNGIGATLPDYRRFIYKHSSLLYYSFKL